jgi:hypothetical protein
VQEKERRVDDRFAMKEDIFVVSASRPERSTVWSHKQSGMAFKYYSIKTRLWKMVNTPSDL